MVVIVGDGVVRGELDEIVCFELHGVGEDPGGLHPWNVRFSRSSSTDSTVYSIARDGVVAKLV